MKEIFLFIYARNGRIMALPHDEAKRIGKDMINQGYKHTATLNAATWMENIHNNCNKIDALKEIESLS